MKAVVYSEYGPADVLRLTEVEKPTPREDEVLIRVHAATVTTGDVNMRGFTFVPKGFGPLPRLMFGIRRPRKPILGVEVAGVVEAVGPQVTEFAPGDRVFGIDSGAVGAYAEYVCRRAAGPLALMPANLSFDEAAALPFGAGTAIYFLRDVGDIRAGQKVLVIGASGGVGNNAVQLAKHFGAEVTGVCSTANLELVKSLGADYVIDYTSEDFTRNGVRYDIIMDAVGKRSFGECKESLTERGVFLASAGGLREMALAARTSIAGSRKVKTGTPPESKAEMLKLKELAEAGKIRAVIDRRYPLEQAAEAHRYVDTGRKKCNVVITVAQPGND
ncbi:MAG: NAD(P)-dependent alcohol dehydrogenase [Nitrospira sp.]